MKYLTNFFIKTGILLPLLLIGSTAFAQEAESEVGALANVDPLMAMVLGLIVLVMALVLITLVMMISLTRHLFVAMQEAEAKAQGIEYVAPKGIITQWWEAFNQRFVLGKLYSQKEERDTMLLDHDYDGIQEMDYGMPPWLTAFFLITVGYAVIYLVNFYGTGIIKPASEEYAIEMEEAQIAIDAWKAKQANLVDESNVEISSDAAVLSAGMEIYMKECKVCHGAEGEGGVGPNMTDDYWIHGGDIASIFSTIKYGVPEKGMISWQTKLSPADMAAVSSYITTFRGTNPANGKEPQGELYVPADAPAPAEEVESPASDSTSGDLQAMNY